jgi:hypothetical protein
MFFAYKYARKKYKQRKESQQKPEAALVSGSAQPAPDAAVEAGCGGTDAPPIARGAVTDHVLEAKEPQASDTLKTEKEDAPSYETPQEKARRRKYRWMIILGLFAPFTLQSLDMTIVASALPYIATDFGKSLPVSLLFLNHPLFLATQKANASSQLTTSPLAFYQTK